jgi:hypothetical protein
MIRLPPPFRRKVDPPANADPIPHPDVVRRWSDQYLHSRLAQAGMQPYHREVLASELRVREAWRSPDSWAFVVALVSLLVAVAALIVSIIAG